MSSLRPRRRFARIAAFLTFAAVLLVSTSNVWADLTTYTLCDYPDSQACIAPYSGVAKVTGTITVDTLPLNDNPLVISYSNITAVNLQIQTATTTFTAAWDPATSPSIYGYALGLMATSSQLYVGGPAIVEPFGQPGPILSLFDPTTGLGTGYSSFLNPYTGEWMGNHSAWVWVDGEAHRFCNILTAWPEEKAKGFVYRLPTEAEWEYACRAGTTTRYSFGDTEADISKYVWYCDNSGWAVRAVGVKEPNAWNLHDMNGNTWEWCADWFFLDYYKQSPRRDPRGPLTGSKRVIRGGCSCDVPLYCRSASRYRYDPSTREQGVGVRVVISIPCPAYDTATGKVPGTLRPSTTRNDIILADFEGTDYGDWKVEGTAFGVGPAHGTVLDQQSVSGFFGKGLANSYHRGNKSTGKLTSPEFTITRKYITFLIGGVRQDAVQE